MNSPVSRILVANRGEISVRIIRSAAEMGIKTVAVYADPDMSTLACDLADDAYSLKGSDAASTYLDADKLIHIAKRSSADAVHPGYGFLSEDADFAQKVQDAGLIWIGPAPEAIRKLGDKIQARALAKEAHVPMIPGISESLRSDGRSIDDAQEIVLNFASQYDYPIVIKRADSGGGRGITRLDNDEDVRRFFSSHAGDSGLELSFVEKLMKKCRHIETQCMRDSLGNFRVVTTRDCSVQRRNQKVIEEAPAPFLSEQSEHDLTDASKKLFTAAGYVGVGTCEFLVAPDGSVYFLEVNPRLQVEHTVSEEVAGIDLVKEQIRIARGEKLSDPQPNRGHAIEVRVTSEDPLNDLMPTTGTVNSVYWPGGPGVRIDSYLRPGDEVGGNFDSLVGKITTHASTRSEAIARTRRALSECEIVGVPTSIPLIDFILEDPDFVAENDQFEIYTRWLEESGVLQQVKNALEDTNRDAQGNDSSSPDPSPATYVSARNTSSMSANFMQAFTIEVNGRRFSLRLPEKLVNGLTVSQDKQRPSQPLRGQRRVRTQGEGIRASGTVTAPIQGTVIRANVEVGQWVHEGDLLAVLEAMKMERYINAPISGTIEQIAVSPGESVVPGQLILRINASGLADVDADTKSSEEKRGKYGE